LNISKGKTKKNKTNCSQGSYREDILDMYAFNNLNQIRELTGDWQIEYNHDLGHDSLGGKSPVEYARSFSPFTPQPLCERPKGKKLLNLCRTL